MVTRVAFESLPEDVRAAIERGDTVEIERGGRVLGCIEHREDDWPERVRRWKERIASDPPLDYDDFLRDLETIREELNKPAEMPRWE
jgi:hypothetical protein